ncbi:MAG: twin-arginine translocation protein TatA/E family subunit [Frankiales bacterium]|nr:twin-arginine translocation protein TatA/E family subunit [Frankiales bacterium]
MLEFLEKPGVLIVLIIALLVFGQKRLPDAARSLGRSLRILKAETKGLRDDDAQPAPAVQVTQLPPATPQTDLAAGQAPTAPPASQQAPPASS